MGNPIVHFEIRAEDPDAARAFTASCSVGNIPKVESRATRTWSPECRVRSPAALGRRRAEPAW
jgi:hypothetical protein